MDKLKRLMKYKYKIGLSAVIILFESVMNAILRWNGVIVDLQIGADVTLQILLIAILVLVVVEGGDVIRKRLWLGGIVLFVGGLLYYWLAAHTPIMVVYKGSGVLLTAMLLRILLVLMLVEIKERILYLLLAFGLAAIALNYLVLANWDFIALILLGLIQYVGDLFNLGISTEGSTHLIEWKNFRVILGSPCSGISSLITYLVIYVVLLKKYFEKREFLSGILYVVGAVIVLSLNMIRLFILMAVGAFVSADLALDFFHLYSGAILFFVFIIIYISGVRRLLAKKG